MRFFLIKLVFCHTGIWRSIVLIIIDKMIDSY